MDKIVYALCAIACGICVFLLLKGYMTSKARLLLWSGVCFSCLTLANIIVYIDLIIFPEYDLLTLRNILTFVGLATLVFGMIEETV